jgi:hypothetical protein
MGDSSVSEFHHQPTEVHQESADHPYVPPELPKRSSDYVDPLKKFLEEEEIARAAAKASAEKLAAEKVLKEQQLMAKYSINLPEQAKARNSEFQAEMKNAKIFPEVVASLVQLGKKYPTWKYITEEYIPDDERPTFASLASMVEKFQNEYVHYFLKRGLTTLLGSTQLDPITLHPAERQLLYFPQPVQQAMENLYTKALIDWKDLKGLLEQPLAPPEIITLLRRLGDMGLKFPYGEVTLTAKQIIERVEKVSAMTSAELLRSTIHIVPSLFDLDFVVYCFVSVREFPAVFKTVAERNSALQEWSLAPDRLPRRFQTRISGTKASQYKGLIEQLAADFEKAINQV